MSYVLNARERKLMSHLELDHRSFAIPGELPTGFGAVTFDRLTQLGLLEAGPGRHGITGYRITDDGWRCMYGMTPAKDAANLVKHGVSLADFTGFDAAIDVRVDDRFDYGEVRFRAFGRIDGKGFSIAYTETAIGIRLISFRRAHEKELRRYE